MFSRHKRFLLAAIMGVLGVMSQLTALAGVPAFNVEDIGVGVPIDINGNNVILGQDSYAAPSLPWVYDGGVRTYLPLPDGVATAVASRISEAGVVVGQVTSQPAIWRPGTGGYTLQILPLPDGATVGKAIDVNGSGAVILTYGTPATTSTGMTYIIYKPYLLTQSGDLVDLTTIYTVSGATFPDLMDLTENGRILTSSGEILEPDGTVTPTPAFPPRPPGGYSWVAFRATRMNEAGAFIGVATLSSSMGYAQVVKFTPGSGWTVLGGLSSTVSGLGISMAGDALIFANYVCPAAYGLAYAVNGGSTYCFEDLVLDPSWSFQSYASKGVISPNGTIAALGYSYASGSYRLSLLRPAGDLPPPPVVSLTATPHPGTYSQPYDAITLSWTSAGFLAKAYSIERIGPGEGSFKEIARIGATVTQYNDQAIQPLASYTYRVAGIGLAGAGPYSNEVTAQAPPEMDRIAPDVTITNPTDGATVTGTVTASATFTDNVGLVYASLEYQPNMGNGIICQKTPATASPTLTLSCKWDTSKVAYQSPTATLTAYGYDALGNWVQKSVTVNVTYASGGGGKGGGGGRPRK